MFAPRSAVAAIALAIAGSSAPAQGLHVGPDQEPQPDLRRPVRPPIRPIVPAGLRIEDLKIQTRIVDGIATTTLRQVFHNGGARIAEGTWILPLPAGSTADGFKMTMNGQLVAGEVLDANRARAVYEGIVRRQRDPGLLEYMGDGCLRARVFPIPAQGDMVVEVRYRQVLPESGGTHGWTFPLRAANVHGRPAQRISLDLTIRSQQPIRNVYSPFPGADVVRRSDHEARVSLELRGGKAPSRDLQVYYGLSEQAFGLTLLTHRREGQAGYFALMIAPKLEWDPGKTLPRSIHFVLDTSGSMNGKKIEQARGALRFFVNSLGSADHFNVVPFSTEARPFFDRPVPASPDNVAKALRMTDELQARGGTNIERALLTALSAPLPDVANVVAMTVFLTDGMPTVDTTDPEALLKLVEQSNQGRQRVFVFGIGHDVNTRLLDKLAETSHGARDYVKEDESIEVKTGALFTKLSHPVMSRVRIDCDGVDGFDVFPRTTPDLFKGSRLMLTGRYRGTGHHAIRLRGIVEGKEQTFVYEGRFPTSEQDHDFLPTLWAQRKVAVLLDAIRLNGANRELIDEIRRLGTEHGIVTPYTSHLILEEGARLGRARFGAAFDPESPARGAPGTEDPGAFRDRLRRELLRAGDVAEDQAAARVEHLDETVTKSKNEAKKDLDGFAEQSGKAAVRRSRALRVMAEGDKVGGGGGGGAGLVTRAIAGHTFHLIGGMWIDGRFTTAMNEAVREVRAFSDEYFALLRRHPELRRVFAFSSRILVVIDGRAVEIH